MNITDPCSDQLGWDHVLAIYGKYVMSGANCTNKEETRSATIKGYFLV